MRLVRMRLEVIVLVVALGVCTRSGFGREALWLEGEDFVSSSFNRHGWYQNANVSKDLLSPGTPGVSDGAWHTHYTGGYGNEAVTVTYRLAIGEGGIYNWWLRLNPFRNHNGGANYSYRIRQSGRTWTAWQTVDVSEARDGMIDLVDPAIDIRFIAWCFGGPLSLGPGSHELAIRLARRDGEKENHGGIDVMALTNFPWSPAGVTPPSTATPETQPDEWFRLMAGPDSFSPESIIDVSHLIDKPAGLHGVLHADGKDFVFEDGTPVRFWGVGASMAETVEAQQRQARLYVKHGINMVRQHPVQGVVGSLVPCGRDRCFDPERIDRLDRWFSILKDNGIYMTWSIFYHHVVLPDEGIDPSLYNELPDRDAGKDTYGLATFIDEYQGSQWEYARRLLNHVNPYTGLAYKDDPALAIVEMRNEDSVFFHNPLSDDFARGLRYPHHGARLKRLWQQWVKREYGNDTALARVWGAGMKKSTIRNGNGSVRSRPDSVSEANMYIYAAWEMEKDGPRWNKQRERARMGDFIRFLAEMQRASYERYRQRLRDLGYRGVTVSTAWKAGGPAASAANLWTDDAMDAIDRHNYFGGGAGGHGIATGSVNNDTHLTKPGRGILSSGLWQVFDKPFVITEWTQKPPNQWKAEIAPLVAFYGMGLQGWDASYHFAGSRSTMGDGWPRMRSYVTETPHYLGQFPALAFAIYHGHFDEGPLVSHRRFSEAEIFAGVDVLEQTYGLVGYDQNELLAHGETPVEALAIGRVALKVEPTPPPSYLARFADFLDKSSSTVRSATGQLAWDYGNQVVVVHAEKTQGVIGFAAGKRIDLPGVVVEEIDTPFVSLLLTPLDNAPLTASKHILITAMAQDRQLGTVYNEDGTQLLESGGPPLLLEPVQATLTFKGEPVGSVTVVDVYGVPTDREVERSANTLRIDGRYATYYYEVTRP